MDKKARYVDSTLCSLLPIPPLLCFHFTITTRAHTALPPCPLQTVLSPSLFLLSFLLFAFLYFSKLAAGAQQRISMDGSGGRRRVSRETSPDRARVGFSAERQGRVRASLVRRVHIVYYLSRNGQLEHPHFMELSQLPNQQLRLKDVMERLTNLRGKGMPSLYSWSCKRSYKNGYVWNDLSENDVVYPADGAEYVLKGSEIIPGCSSERFQQLRQSNRAPKPLSTRTQIEPEYEDVTEDDDEEEIEEEQEARNLTAAAAGGTRCSRGVSTDEFPDVAKKLPISSKPRGPHHQTEIPVDDGSPPSSSSSDPAVEPAGLTRNSVFLNLIACGSGAAVKGRKSGGNPQKGVVSRRVGTRASRVEDEEAEVRFMSENPRFGNLQGEDKEYFSGSIVLEATRRAAPAGEQPAGLKKSSSYNEERCSKVIGIEEDCLVVGEERGGGVKGKCIPGRRKPSSKLQQQQQQQANK